MTEFVWDGRHRYRKSALDVGYSEGSGSMAGVRICEFGDLAPERFKGLIVGLRKHFTNTRFWVETTEQMCVFAVGSDARQIELMRAFCAGYAAAL